MPQIQVHPDTLPPPDLCFRCTYDLRGVADDAPCPECGLLAIRSRLQSEALRDSRPAWLAKLSIGVWLMLAGLILALVWAYGVESLMRWVGRLLLGWAGWGRRPPRWEWAYVNAYFEGFALAAGLFAFGAILLTAPEGRPRADRADRWRRWAIRIAVLVPLLVVLAGYIRWNWGRGNPMLGLIPRNLNAVILAFILCAPFPVLLFTQLRSLGRRVLSRQLPEHSAIVGWGLSTTALTLAATAWYAQKLWHGPTRWLQPSDSLLLMTLITSVLIGLFFFWSIYLMARFAAAFWQARREALEAWRQADRGETR